MTDKPIIFSAPMVRAMIEGRKTQTRRVLKPQPREDAFFGPEWYSPVKVDRHGNAYPGPEVFGIYGDEWGQILPYAPGDRLWVKEAVTWVSAWGWRYRADNDDLSEKREQGEVGRWRSPIFMPRMASRLTHTVTDVRVQRVRDISLGDCYAEGCTTGKAEADAGVLPVGWTGPWDEYGTLWNSLHAKPKPVKGPDGKVSHYVSYPWEPVQETRTFRGLPWIITGNPWVAAYTFTVQLGNIDGGKA